jgi:hypothetical protein
MASVSAAPPPPLSSGVGAALSPWRGWSGGLVPVLLLLLVLLLPGGLGLGKVWLEHLLPESDVRSEMIEETELLRGVRLLASFAHRGEDSLSTLMVRYASGETAPQSAIQVS